MTTTKPTSFKMLSVLGSILGLMTACSPQGYKPSNSTATGTNANTVSLTGTTAGSTCNANNIIPKSASYPAFSGCSASVDAPKVLLAGKSQSDMVCVFPLQFTTSVDFSYRINPSNSLPKFQCVSASLTGIEIDFSSALPYNGLMVVDLASRDNVIASMLNGSLPTSPFSIGKIR
jgi:hypothetical protein